MRQRQIPLQPGLVILRPFCNISPGIRSAQHCAQRHPDHFPQIMPLRRARSRIGQHGKHFRPCHFPLQTKSEDKLIPPESTSPLNRLFVIHLLPVLTTFACAIALGRLP
jgi:hypothetical protein